MKDTLFKKLFILLFIPLLVFVCSQPLFAGSRAAFTRGGWVGAKYMGMGMAAEVVADDAFSIYWNPAGLAELKEAKKLSAEEIRSRATRGDVDSFSEEDLLRFSDVTAVRFAVHFAASGAMLEHDRNAGFAGVAFNAFNGVLGAGLYTIGVTGIEGYDESGAPTGNLSYVASAGFLSYGWSSGPTNMGVSFKGLYEKIDSTVYAGAGADLGVQISVLPFFRLGAVAQDLGSFLRPVSNDEGVDKKYDFAAPSLRLGASIVSDAGFVLAFGIAKRFEQDDYIFSFGIDYRVDRNINLYAGIRDGNLSGGLSIDLLNVNIGYAIAVDSVDYGYNNMVSVLMSF